MEVQHIDKCKTYELYAGNVPLIYTYWGWAWDLHQHWILSRLCAIVMMHDIITYKTQRNLTTSIVSSAQHSTHFAVLIKDLSGIQSQSRVTCTKKLCLSIMHPKWAFSFLHIEALRVEGYPHILLYISKTGKKQTDSYFHFLNYHEKKMTAAKQLYVKRNQGHFVNFSI